MLRCVAFFLSIVLLTAPAQAQAPQRGGDLPQPLPLFPPGNWWNTDISAAPVDAQSAAYIAYVGATRGMHPDFGGDSGEPSAPIYGMPYIVVAGSQPLLPVSFDYDDESDIGAPGRPPGYPIPEEAKTQQKWIEGGLSGSDPNADGDRHMLLVDRDSRILYELYALHWNGARWEAGSGATFRSIRTRAAPMAGRALTQQALPFCRASSATTKSTEPRRSATPFA
jgi:hypothetical protein